VDALCFRETGNKLHLFGNIFPTIGGSGTCALAIG
jgi:hypothetical protein